MFDHCVDITKEMVVIFELNHAWFRCRANVTQIQYPARLGRFRVLVVRLKIVCVVLGYA